MNHCGTPPLWTTMDYYDSLWVTMEHYIPLLWITVDRYGPLCTTTTIVFRVQIWTTKAFYEHTMNLHYGQL